MKFGPVATRDAEGAVLAHSLGLPDGRLKKGRELGPDDIARLIEAGIEEITVARLGPEDLPEDDAARRVAEALVPDPAGTGLKLSAPFTGRANVYAEHAGILTVDVDAVSALNAIDEALTLATLDHHARVARRQMVATVKIIPYAAPISAVEGAEATLAGAEVMRVHPFAISHVRLILTRTEGMKPALLTKGADAVRARLTALGIDRVDEQVVEHETEALARALEPSRAEMTLILTGSATSDRADVGPAALLSAGGELIRFGMPVDPGNLLFLGRIGEHPVLGLPGCARSPKLNGADWVLERLAAGLDVTGADVAAMGVGGLLKEIPSRPEPRGGGAEAPLRPTIGAVLLAAGGSTRMRGADKLLETVGSQTLLGHVAGEIAGAGIDQTVAVIRPGDTDRRKALAASGAKIVENPRAPEGMATSLGAGISALDQGVDAALIVLGDMPEIRAVDLDRLIAAFDPGEGRAIVRAVSPEGRPGHPVLFGKRFFEGLRALEGDRGARKIVAEHPEFVVDVVLPGARATVDLDTPEAWAEWRARQGESA